MIRGKTEFILADFVVVHNQVARSDYITLDKVVCCYPNYEEIIAKSCQKARNYVSLSYPMDGFIAEVIAWFGVIFARLKTNSFRPYLHSVRKIRGVFEQQGYERAAHSLAFPWHIETYHRVEE